MTPRPREKWRISRTWQSGILTLLGKMKGLKAAVIRRLSGQNQLNFREIRLVAAFVPGQQGKIHGHRVSAYVKIRER